jgi:hypothetical protein
MRLLALAWIAAITWLVPTATQANPNDISLLGLGRPRSTSAADPAVRRYQNLTSELVFAVAPRPLAPAETLGVSGFEFSIATTTADINELADYWQGQPGMPVFEGVLPQHGSRGIPTSFWVPTVHLRKGLPMSTEVGLNASYLAWSEMAMLGLDMKIALHESYFRWVPAVSLRGAAARLFGSSDLDVVTIETDLLASLPFGVGGMVQLTPYLGFGFLWAHVNSEVLDETPNRTVNCNTADNRCRTDTADQKGGADGSLYTFPTLEWSNNRHDRLLFGLRVNVAMLEVIYEVDVGFLGRDAGTLISHSLKLGFDV